MKTISLVFISGGLFLCSFYVGSHQARQEANVSEGNVSEANVSEARYDATSKQGTSATQETATTPSVAEQRPTQDLSTSAAIQEPGLSNDLGSETAKLFSMYYLNEAQHASGTMLGVHVIQPDRTLRKHLRLGDGMGLVIEHVINDSAAADANLQVDDILVAFGDQQLINQEQLTTLVRNQAVGDVIRLSLIREGQPIHVEVTLKVARQNIGNLESARFPIQSDSSNAFHVELIELSGHKQFADVSNCALCHVPVVSSLTPLLNAHKTEK